MKWEPFTFEELPGLILVTMLVVIICFVILTWSGGC